MIIEDVNKDTEQDNKDLAGHALAWMALLEAARDEVQEQVLDIEDSYTRMSVEQLLASKNKKLRQIGHQLKYYGKV